MPPVHAAEENGYLGPGNLTDRSNAFDTNLVILWSVASCVEQSMFSSATFSVRRIARVSGRAQASVLAAGETVRTSSRLGQNYPNRSRPSSEEAAPEAFVRHRRFGTEALQRHMPFFQASRWQGRCARSRHGRYKTAPSRSASPSHLATYFSFHATPSIVHQ